MEERKIKSGLFIRWAFRLMKWPVIITLIPFLLFGGMCGLIWFVIVMGFMSAKDARKGRADMETHFWKTMAKKKGE